MPSSTPLVTPATLFTSSFKRAFLSAQKPSVGPACLITLLPIHIDRLATPLASGGTYNEIITSRPSASPDALRLQRKPCSAIGVDVLCSQHVASSLSVGVFSPTSANAPAAGDAAAPTTADALNATLVVSVIVVFATSHSGSLLTLQVLFLPAPLLSVTTVISNPQLSYMPVSVSPKKKKGGMFSSSAVKRGNNSQEYPFNADTLTIGASCVFIAGLVGCISETEGTSSNSDPSLQASTWILYSSPILFNFETSVSPTANDGTPSTVSFPPAAATWTETAISRPPDSSSLTSRPGTPVITAASPHYYDRGILSISTIASPQSPSTLGGGVLALAGADGHAKLLSYKLVPSPGATGRGGGWLHLTPLAVLPRGQVPHGDESHRVPQPLLSKLFAVSESGGDDKLPTRASAIECRRQELLQRQRKLQSAAGLESGAAALTNSAASKQAVTAAQGGAGSVALPADSARRTPFLRPSLKLHTFPTSTPTLLLSLATPDSVSLYDVSAIAAHSNCSYRLHGYGGAGSNGGTRAARSRTRAATEAPPPSSPDDEEHDDGGGDDDDVDDDKASMASGDLQSRQQAVSVAGGRATKVRDLGLSKREAKELGGVKYFYGRCAVLISEEKKPPSNASAAFGISKNGTVQTLAAAVTGGPHALLSVAPFVTVPVSCPQNHLGQIHNADPSKVPSVDFAFVNAGGRTPPLAIYLVNLVVANTATNSGSSYLPIFSSFQIGLPSFGKATSRATITPLREDYVFGQSGRSSSSRLRQSSTALLCDETSLSINVFAVCDAHCRRLPVFTDAQIRAIHELSRPITTHLTPVYIVSKPEVQEAATYHVMSVVYGGQASSSGPATPVQRHFLCRTTIGDSGNDNALPVDNEGSDDQDTKGGAVTKFTCELTCSGVGNAPLVPHHIITSPDRSSLAVSFIDTASFINGGATSATLSTIIDLRAPAASFKLLLNKDICWIEQGCVFLSEEGTVVKCGENVFPTDTNRSLSCERIFPLIDKLVYVFQGGFLAVGYPRFDSSTSPTFKLISGEIVSEAVSLDRLTGSATQIFCAIVTSHRVMIMKCSYGSFEMVNQHLLKKVGSAVGKVAVLGPRCVVFFDGSCRFRYLTFDASGVVCTLGARGFNEDQLTAKAEGSHPITLLGVTADRIVYLDDGKFSGILAFTGGSRSEGSISLANDTNGSDPHLGIYGNVVITKAVFLLEAIVASFLSDLRSTVANPNNVDEELYAIVRRFGMKVDEAPFKPNEGIGRVGMGVSQKLCELLYSKGKLDILNDILFQGQAEGDGRTVPTQWIDRSVFPSLTQLSSPMSGNDADHFYSRGPHGKKSELFRLDTVEEWLGRAKPTLLGRDVNSAAAGVKTLAEILAGNSNAKEAEEEAGGEVSNNPSSWVAGVGSGRNDEANLSGYWRFSDVGAEFSGSSNDLSQYSHVGKINTKLVSAAITNSAVDEGEEGKFHLLYDLVSGITSDDFMMGVEANHGTSLDVGMGHLTESCRNNCSIELWLKPTGGEVDKEICVMSRLKLGEGESIESASSTLSTYYWRVAINPANKSLKFSTPGGGAGNEVCSAADVIEFDKWNHICVVMQGSSSERSLSEVDVKLYVKAVSVAEGVVKVAIAEKNPSANHRIVTPLRSGLCFGGNVVSGTRMTELRIWSCCRKSDSIADTLTECLKEAEIKKKKFVVKIKSGGDANKTAGLAPPNQQQLHVSTSPAMKASTSAGPARSLANTKDCVVDSSTGAATASKTIAAAEVAAIVAPASNPTATIGESAAARRLRMKAGGGGGDGSAVAPAVGVLKPPSLLKPSTRGLAHSPTPGIQVGGGDQAHSPAVENPKTATIETPFTPVEKPSGHVSFGVVAAESSPEPENSVSTIGGSNGNGSQHPTPESTAATRSSSPPRGFAQRAALSSTDPSPPKARQMSPQRQARPSVPNEEALAAAALPATAPVSAPAPASVTAQISMPLGIPSELLDGVMSSWRKLCITPSGLLYDSPILQVGLKHEYKGYQGRISMSFCNMSSAPIAGLKVALANTAPNLRATKSEASDPAMLTTTGIGRTESKSRVTMTMMVEALTPFIVSPILTVSFTHDGANHVYPMRLPIVPSAFVEAVAPLEKDAFMQRWGALAGDREAQEIVQMGRAVGTEDMDKVLKVVTEGMRMARCASVDSGNSVSAVGTFRTGSKDAAGNNISVGCLVRVDANGQAVRVTSRTLDPTLSKALKANIVAALK